MRVLVIEDDRKIQEFVSRGLRQEGHTVEVATTGTEVPDPEAEVDDAAIEMIDEGGPVAEEAEESASVAPLTPEEEMDAYLIVKAILREIVSSKRIAMRDVKSYCSVLLDDTNRKPICRFHFNSRQKYLGVIDENRVEERIPISELDDIYQYADRLKATVASYEQLEPQL